MIKYWKNEYKWSEREKYLNQFSQYKVKIQGLNIHFLHVKPKYVDNIQIKPLLLLHGWPGSVREFYKIIPFLTQAQKDRKFVFEVIAPSLPGYGFSDPAAKPGLGPAEIGVIFKNLMLKLGFEKFYIQGGDWGSCIGGHMAILFPKNVLGFHSNMCYNLSPKSFIKTLIGSLYPPFVVNKENEKSMYPLKKLYIDTLIETGYAHLHATYPDTLGVALTDSPVGLAAYILEKFAIWTDKSNKKKIDAGLLQKFTADELLDNIMIYWVTKSITTSMRIYSEYINTEAMSVTLEQISIKIPTACAKFQNELTYQPDWILKDKYVNLLHSKENMNGGHFAAFENPKELADEIFHAVEQFDDFNRINVL